MVGHEEHHGFAGILIGYVIQNIFHGFVNEADAAVVMAYEGLAYAEVGDGAFGPLYAIVAHVGGDFGHVVEVGGIPGR